MTRVEKIAGFTLLMLPSLLAQASCGGAFCSLNTNWDVQGIWTKPGIRLDLRAEYIEMDQLRDGSSRTSAAGIVDTHDEKRTINRNYIATLDWSIDPKWGVTLRAPLVDRNHQHVHNEDDGAGGVESEKESWKFSKMGDMQVLGRYAFYQDERSTAGVRFGLKLPTGTISQRNGSGAKAERTLQPGTGSTDGLVGLYYNHRMGDMSWFVQGMWQQAMNERDDFRPGRHVSADIGMAYAATPKLNLLVQLNTLYKSRDKGANAQPEDSGGHSVFVSPGLSYRVTDTVQMYGFVQKPIYQYVNGTQLTTDWTASVGISSQF